MFYSAQKLIYISFFLFCKAQSTTFFSVMNHRLARADFSLGLCLPVNASSQSIVAANDSKLPTQKFRALIIHSNSSKDVKTNEAFL